jgi:hypothetical protein
MQTSEGLVELMGLWDILFAGRGYNYFKFKDTPFSRRLGYLHHHDDFFFGLLMTPARGLIKPEKNGERPPN